MKLLNSAFRPGFGFSPPKMDKLEGLHRNFVIHEGNSITTGFVNILISDYFITCTHLVTADNSWPETKLLPNQL